jgi:hypothetical protein
LAARLTLQAQPTSCWTPPRGIPELFGNYEVVVSVLTNLTSNGLIHFHRKPDEHRGFLAFSPGVQRLQGRGYVEFEGTSFAS